MKWKTFHKISLSSVSSIIGDRNKQEDYLDYVSRSDESLFVVCDGMGRIEKKKENLQAKKRQIHWFMLFIGEYR